MIQIFFFSSRRRHTRQESVSWARRCVQETGPVASTLLFDIYKTYGVNLMARNSAKAREYFEKALEIAQATNGIDPSDLQEINMAIDVQICVNIGSLCYFILLSIFDVQSAVVYYQGGHNYKCQIHTQQLFLKTFAQIHTKTKT
eukprot:TRINITY_DN7386_c0_g1_i2.p2 TRINITY_DN7386_c0_g1~~TRINITY_DN7386_c0_g1_i2.p2  ORF type:complete len:144 (-),score=23.02 TRINITY_DN7386_c0_g1_i2:942-1373(-)